MTRSLYAISGRHHGDDDDTVLMCCVDTGEDPHEAFRWALREEVGGLNAADESDRPIYVNSVQLIGHQVAHGFKLEANLGAAMCQWPVGATLKLQHKFTPELVGWATRDARGAVTSIDGEKSLDMKVWDVLPQKRPISKLATGAPNVRDFPRIVITISGGNLQDVTADKAVQVVLVDHDTDDTDGTIYFPVTHDAAECDRIFTIKDSDEVMDQSDPILPATLKPDDRTP